MKKIVNIVNDIVYIGNEDGSFQEVRLEDCSFKPAVGDLVNVFSNESKTIVTKIETPKPADSISDKVHINIVNENKNDVNSGNPLVLVQGGKVVNKVIYCLLAFFFGFIGVHKFYAGRIGLGFVYLIFSITFIPAIIAFFEFIVALFKSSDANGNIIV